MPTYRRLLAPPDYLRRVDVPESMVADRIAGGFRVDPFPDDRGDLQGSTPGRHRGRPALVLASGPSAGMVPPHELRAWADSLGAVCWTTNDVWRVCRGLPFPGADYVVILDEPFWSSWRRMLGEYLALYPGCLPVLAFTPRENIRYQRVAIDRARPARVGLPYLPNRYFHGDSSGIAAVQMAMHCGCDPIVLLGHDLTVTADATHGAGIRTPDEHRKGYPQGARMRAGYALLAEHAAALGIRVLNASPVSTIDCFERGALASVAPGSPR